VGLARAVGYDGGMALHRFTIDEAKAEAIRLATEFKQTVPKSEEYRFSHAIPYDSAAKSGKTPAVWLGVFTCQPPGEVVDGGELIIRVNVQKKSAELCPRFC
jgi:hypothetical protein